MSRRRAARAGRGRARSAVPSRSARCGAPIRARATSALRFPAAPADASGRTLHARGGRPSPTSRAASSAAARACRWKPRPPRRGPRAPRRDRPRRRPSRPRGRGRRARLARGAARAPWPRARPPPGPGAARAAARGPSGTAATRPSDGPSGSRPRQTISPEARRKSRSAGRYLSMRAGRTSASSAEAGMGAPWSCSTAERSASSPVRGRATPCHSARKRANAAGSTGSTSRRSFASDRRLIARRTPASHHSREDPPGRKSPSSTRPRSASRSSARRTIPTARPKRAAASSSRNGPCVRA